MPKPKKMRASRGVNSIYTKLPPDVFASRFLPPFLIDRGGGGGLETWEGQVEVTNIVGLTFIRVRIIRVIRVYKGKNKGSITVS